MALKTRILLRNDELSNWTGSSLVLGKGEMAIATLDGEYVEVRVGDGTHTWAESYKLKVTAAQISGLVETIQGTAKKYQIVANGSTTNSWKLQSEPLSATTDEWVDVSTFTVELSDYYNKSEVNGISATLSSGLLGTASDTSSANTIYGAKVYANEVANTAETAAKTYADGLCAQLSTTTAETYLSTATFDAYKDEVGLTAASSENPVATKNDIASLDKVMHFKGVVNAVPESTEGYEVGDVVLVAGATGDAAKDNGKEFVLVNIGTDANPNLKWELIGDQNAISALTEYVNTEIGNLSNAVTADYATKDELIASAHGLSTDYNTKIENITSTYATKEYADSTSAYALGQAKAYTETLSGEVEAISAIITSDYAEKTYVNGISAALSTTVEADYIKHGEVVQSDLSGFFILDCGASALRTGEPTELTSA